MARGMWSHGRSSYLVHPRLRRLRRRREAKRPAVSSSQMCRCSNAYMRRSLMTMALRRWDDALTILDWIPPCAVHYQVGTIR